MKESRTEYYYYTDSTNVIRVLANRKPSRDSQPISGTWALQEFTNERGWVSPCFGEVMINRLEQMQYIGSNHIPDTGKKVS